MDLTPFKCFVCKILPEEDVFMCSNKHINCIQCAKQLNNICQCTCDLKLSQNPLECALLQVNANCIFKPNGCTWMFAVKDLHKHLGECKYRPYICVGKKLNVSECSWEGFKHQVADHFKESHSSRKMYSYSEEDKVLFAKDNENIFTAINLLDAFNKTFVFYYESNRAMNTVSMIIYLLGRQQDAKKYMYEIEIWNELDKPQRIKFMQACYSDADDIPELIKSGKCLSISQTVIKNYVHENEIYFRFRMHKRNTSVPAKSQSCTNLNVLAKNISKDQNRKPTERNQQPRYQQPRSFPSPSHANIASMANQRNNFIPNYMMMNTHMANHWQFSGAGFGANLFPVPPRRHQK